MTRPLSRRHLLRGLGTTAISLPLLEAMGCTKPDGEIVAAKESALDPGGELAPQRFLLYVTGNGGIGDDYFPVRRSDTDFDLGPSMQIASVHPDGRMVEEFRDRMLLVDGLVNYTQVSGHEAHGSLTTCRGINGAQLGLGRSFDRYIADHIRETDPSAPPHVLLNLASKTATAFREVDGVEVPHEGNRFRFLSYESAATPAPNLGRPQEVFDMLFAGSDSEVAARELARRERRASLLDDVLEDYGSLHRRLGTSDARRLDEHMQRIRDVERQLRAPLRDCGSATALPEFDYNISESRYLPELEAQWFHLIELAFACDATRVVTYMSRSEGEFTDHTFPWLSFGVCDNDVSDPNTSRCNDSGNGRVSHHNMSHSQQFYRENLLEAMRWQVGQLTNIAGRLQDISEGTSTVLDSSFCLHMSAGMHTHTSRRLPSLGIGSLGGKLKQGVSLRYDEVALSEYWLTIMRAFGCTDETFGDPTYCREPIAAMFA